MLAFHSRWIVLLLVAALFTATSATAADQPAKLPEVGDEAADFKLESIEGESVQFAKLLEEGPVVLVMLRGFPGYQCPICSIQVSDFLNHADAFAEQGTRVVFVYPGPSDGLGEKAGQFVGKRVLPEHFTFLLDPDYSMTNAYGLRWDAPRETAYPSTLVIDGASKIRFAVISQSHGGRTKAEDVLKAVQELK